MAVTLLSSETATMEASMRQQKWVKCVRLHRKLYPLVPPYPNILYPLIKIKIVLVSPVPLPPLRGIDPIYGVLPIVLVPLGALPYPAEI